MPSDPLFDLKNAFYIGNYQGCINEAQRTKTDDIGQKKDLDVFMYRSYIALKKYGLVLDELERYSGPEEVLDLRLLAEFLSREPQARGSVCGELEKRLSSFSPKNETLPIVGATIYMHQGDFVGALKVLSNCATLESMALTLQCYLLLDRIDLATKELNRMVSADEDASLTQLCSGWLHLHTGGDKLQEAFYIFTEMADKNTKTPLLAVGLASVLIAQGKYEEADQCLADALEKDPNHVETVINQIVVSQFLGKSPEVSTRLLAQLKSSNYLHPFVQDYQAKEQEFKKLGLAFAH
ncbi:coatomer subunit epsilon-like [Tropilaelaps mercedesae]|uniref:Coatomer subunit epsilon n=1 Tax=Tropilaelaps mercedesae TaxID=418985 RepID=A0A1V9XEQ0_9ACAR|nr:coatomer subunit epsilon-like [Tropilaelaps mercedesae]